MESYDLTYRFLKAHLLVFFLFLFGPYAYGALLKDLDAVVHLEYKSAFLFVYDRRHRTNVPRWFNRVMSTSSKDGCYCGLPMNVAALCLIRSCRQVWDTKRRWKDQNTRWIKGKSWGIE
ncbi:hypothetical protein EDD21DRAFT_376833 [Dissophora ornata]|nr:hypothetical protein EDD21DRAFT_376833 [Dissophora ornata]